MINPAALAEWLRAEHANRRPFRPFPPTAAVATLDDAYEVQDAFVAQCLDDRPGRSRAGYKVGLTSARMQLMCGIDQPVAGVILSDRVHASDVRLSLSDFDRLGLEFEIAVRIARPLPAGGAPYKREDIAAAVGGLAPAVEVVDDRHAAYTPLDVKGLIADNAWNEGAVVGPLAEHWPDPAGLVGIVRRNGDEESRGTGADVLGHPFEPVRWLANHLAARGGGLDPGDIVLTGSIARTVFPTEPVAYDLELVGLGRVRVDVVA